MNRAAVTVRPPAAFGARPRTQAKVCVREKTASGIFLRRPAPHARRSAPRAAESQWVGHSATTNFTSDRSIGLNWYAYAGGNPINFADPTGYGASRVLDAMQGGLTALGFAPGVGAVADLVNAGISAGRGDFVGAGFNLASSLPGLGDAFAAGKIATAAVGVAVAKSASHAESSTAATAAKVEAAVVKEGATVTETFFEGAKYSPKALHQMSKTDDVLHAFPQSVDGFANQYGQRTTKTGADGKAYQWLEMRGSYGGKTGTFEFIKDSNGVINHRYLKPD